jgi:hypothetical protein
MHCNETIYHPLNNTFFGYDDSVTNFGPNRQHRSDNLYCSRRVKATQFPDGVLLMPKSLKNHLQVGNISVVPAIGW